MPISRRSFVKGLGAVPLLPGWVLARGREGEPAAERGTLAPPPALIRLHSNENPHGPAPSALDAVRGALGEAARYPDAPVDELRAALAAAHGVAPESVLLGCGSSDVLRMAVSAFTSPSRGLVTGAPSFEYAAIYARAGGATVRAVPVDAALRLDLGGMASASRGAGLVYLCNPNNPTGTVHAAAAVRDFVAGVRSVSPPAAAAVPAVLVDEAYHEYVEDPAYASAVPLAARERGVVVARTFSKAYGLAGLRVGYAVAHPETIALMQRHEVIDGVNLLAAVAALSSLRASGHAERQRTLNREARDFTRRFFERAGFAVAPSQANFLMADIRRDARGFQTACRKQGVLVGRPFPPLTTHARVTVGTMEEMERAVAVFRRVLATG